MKELYLKCKEKNCGIFIGAQGGMFIDVVKKITFKGGKSGRQENYVF